VKITVFDGELVCEAADKVLCEDERGGLEGLLVKDFDEEEEAPVFTFFGRCRGEEAI
jgi:hypothetical protein